MSFVPYFSNVFILFTFAILYCGNEVTFITNFVRIYSAIILDICGKAKDIIRIEILFVDFDIKTDSLH